MGARSAPALDFAGEVRAATRMPTFHAARIQDVATARHAIESGKLDMVGMTRAHLADPHIGRKIAEGREHAIRPCVGMGYCIDSIYAGQAVCIHNAATGREDFNGSGSAGLTYAFTPWCSVGATVSGTTDRSSRKVFDYDVVNSGANAFFRLRF